MSFGKSLSRELGKNTGKYISNKVFGTGHSSPHRVMIERVERKKQREEAREYKLRQKEIEVERRARERALKNAEKRRQEELKLQIIEENTREVSEHTVSAMWRNPFYCGIHKNSFLNGEIIEGNWERLVSKEDFKIINDRFDTKPKNEYKPYTVQQDRPLQNQLYCGCCGSKMTGYKAKKIFDYYKYLNSECKSKDMNANTSKKSMKEGLHNIFQNLLLNFALKEDLEEVFKEQIKITVNGQSSRIYQDQIVLKKRFKELKTKKETLDSRFAFGEIDKELYNRFIGPVTSELVEIEEKLDDFQIKISNLDKKVLELIEFSRNLSNIWVSGEYETKLSVQKLLFPNGIVINSEDRTYRTSNLNPIFGLIHSFTGGNDDLNKKRTNKNTSPSCVVDNPIEISNIRLTPRYLINTHHIMSLIMKN